VVISDKKLLSQADNTQTEIKAGDYFSPDVLSFSDTYPFGMSMRSFNPNATRYGFQGQEKENDVIEGGFAFKYRIHDARIGRFLSIDPLSPDYPHYTPYSFSGNKVIQYVELEGLEEAKFELQFAQRDAPKLGMTTAEFMKKTNVLRKATVEGFKSAFPSGGTARFLIHNYGHGGGKEINLNQTQMLEIYPTYTVNNDRKTTRPVSLGLSKSEFFSVGDLMPWESKKFEKSVPVYANAAGTLGNFTAIISGVVSINPETGQKQFNGTVTFTDDYDFNASEHRPAGAEAQVTVARWFLPGQPFEINGYLNVTQQDNGSTIQVIAEGEGGYLYLTDPTKGKKLKDSKDHKELGGEAQETQY